MIGPRPFQRPLRYDSNDEAFRRVVFDPSKYSREPLLAWLHTSTSEFRLGYAVVDGKRGAFARFVFTGQTYEREAFGDDADTAVVRLCAIALARLMKIPVREDYDAERKLESEIVAAALGGHVDQADALGRELAIRNSGLAPAMRARTQFQR